METFKLLKSERFNLTLTPLFKGSDDIWESDNKCCAKVTKTQDVDYNISGVFPTTESALKVMTGATLAWLRGHEQRRMKYLRWSYYRYINPAANDGWAALRCGKVCYDKPNKAKAELQKYLASLRSASKTQHSAYMKKEQRNIDRENISIKKNTKGLWLPGSVNTVSTPPPFNPPDCPK